MKQIKIIFGLIILLSLASCTKDFDKINTDPNGITQEEASARYFITGPQVGLYGQGRYSYWRGQLIHGDRYAGYFTFGFTGSWWGGSLGYKYHGGYTNAVWGWLSGYLGQLDNYMKLTAKGGEFENEYMYATGLIMKGLYYQMFTDVFGEVPYSEAGKDGIALPKYDTQKAIYKGIIADLDKAMQIIGDATKSGTNVNDLGNNDLFCKGDMQKWKKLANTLKLRIALRANGAPGDDFSAQAIKAALAANLFLDDNTGDVVIDKDAEINQWGSCAYGDIWHNFGGFGSKWHVGEVMVDYLRDYNDPRLSKYAQPIEGCDTIKYTQPAATGENTEPHDWFFERVEFIRDRLAKVIGNDDFYKQINDSVVAFMNIPQGKYYIGQPSRLSGGMYSYTDWKFFSLPAETVTQRKNEGKKIFGELVMSSAEAYFLRAEAAVKGFSSEDAQTLFSKGITQAMKLWGVDDGQIGPYLASADLAKLTGSLEEKIEKISIQRWLALYTDGFEGWAVARKSGYPKELTKDATNDHIFFIGGDIGAKYPQRLRYGGDAYSKNGSNTEAAVSRQGADFQTTKLWWAKK